jgi:hypothetical protein
MTRGGGGQVRYDKLYITSKEIILRWNKEECSFSVSGYCGK